MNRPIGLLYTLLIALLTLAACVPPTTNTIQSEPPPNATPTPTEAAAVEAVKVESNLDGVFTIATNGGRQSLPSPQQAFLKVGQGVDVDTTGRAILRFADLLTVEVLRDGELRLQELSADESLAVVTVLQNGGALLNDFNPQKEIDRRFTVQTEFAAITATGTRFIVVREANSPLEWIVGLDSAENDLSVTADGVTKSVPTGTARWIAPVGEPSPGIAANMSNLQSWIDDMQSGVIVKEVGEVVWPQADVVADTQPLTQLPEPGEPFELSGVTLALDPQGLFGSPQYRLEDCNGDGISDIVIEAGTLQMDFRKVLARVRALDVTVINRGEPGSGSLRTLDPSRSEIGAQQMEVGSGEGQILSLRADQPYHYAQLAMANGCFLGLSLTPPDESGAPGEPRPAVENWQGLAQAFVRIQQPEDGSSSTTNGFTLAGEFGATVGGSLALRVETPDGQEIQRQSIPTGEMRLDGESQTFQTQVFVDYALPAEVRLRVQYVAASEDRSVLAEDSVLLSPLLPQFAERPYQNGWMQALPVAPWGYEVGMNIDGFPREWEFLQEVADLRWTDINTVVHDQGCENRFSDEPEALRPDLASQVALAYDQNYLFVAFRVDDDGYVNYSYPDRDQRYFLGDAPQLLLDLDLPGDYVVSGVNVDDIQVDFTAAPGGVGDHFEARVALWRLDTLESREFDQALAAVWFTETGYVLEAALPWKSLAFTPEPGARLGIAASVSDNDTPETIAQECMISTAPGRDWRDPTTWGTLVLATPGP